MCQVLPSLITYNSEVRCYYLYSTLEVRTWRQEKELRPHRVNKGGERELRFESRHVYGFEHHEIRRCSPFPKVSQGDNVVSFLLKFNPLSPFVPPPY